MTKKNSAAPLVWLAGLLLAVSIVFPNGPQFTRPVSPVTPAPAPTVPADPKIVEILAKATAADKTHINGLYRALADIVRRDKEKLIKTTEQWELLHANHLNLAIGDTALQGKYEDLDAAIEAVFESKLGKDKEVVPADEKTKALIIEACDIVAASAQ
jgi:hypothetical protein